MYTVLTTIILYGLYKLIRIWIIRWQKGKTLRAIRTMAGQQLYRPAEASGTGNVVNINIVACMPLIRRVLVRMIGFINRWLHTHS
jgi:hypothetical protein